MTVMYMIVMMGMATMMPVISVVIMMAAVTVVAGRWRERVKTLVMMMAWRGHESLVVMMMVVVVVMVVIAGIESLVVVGDPVISSI